MTAAATTIDRQRDDQAEHPDRARVGQLARRPGPAAQTTGAAADTTSPRTRPQPDHAAAATGSRARAVRRRPAPPGGRPACRPRPRARRRARRRAPRTTHDQPDDQQRHAPTTDSGTSGPADRERPAPGRPASTPAARRRGRRASRAEQRAEQHHARAAPTGRASSPASRRSSGAHLGQLGAAGQPAEHVVEGARAAPGHDRAALARPAPVEQLVALGARAAARRGRPPAGRCPRAPSARASLGQGVDDEHRAARGGAATRSRCRSRRPASATARPRPCPPVAPNLQPLAGVVGAAAPAARPASRPSSRRRCRRPEP